MKLRILHTSDWHLGKKLHDIDFLPFQREFLDHLIHLIINENVNVLLVSGDVFDQANPSNEARKLYYSFLSRLMGKEVSVFITAGNHDSPQMINAPAELLKFLDIHVVGHRMEDESEMIFPLKTPDGKLAAVLAAVPFLRDADLRKLVVRETESDRLEQIRSGMKNEFSRLADFCKKQYAGMPAIAMGHLYAQGAHTSESEREIQVGNQAGIPVELFPSYFDYYALGHIHKPQTVSKSGRILYSGSPYPLSFSEREDKKKLILINVQNDTINFEDVFLPEYLTLCAVEGNMEEIRNRLQYYFDNGVEKNDFFELHVKEENYSAATKIEFEEMKDEFEQKGFNIVKYRLTFLDQREGLNALYSGGEISEISVAEVFEKKLISAAYSEEDRILLLEAFHEIYQAIQQEGYTP